MAASILLCTVTKCDLISCAICHCCRENLCLDHLKEHRDRLNAQLIPLLNQVKTLEKNLDRFEMNSTPAYRTIEQWREQAHQTINDFCRKLHERMRVEKKDKPKQFIQAIHIWLEYSIRKQGTKRERIEVVTQTLGEVRQHYEELLMTQIKMKPLMIDENIVIDSDLVSSLASDRMKRKTQHNSDDECRSVASNSFMLKQDFAALLDESPSQIFFQYMGKTHSLMITRFDSIVQIKQKIADKIGIPPEQQCLKLTGKILRNQDWMELVDVLQHHNVVLSLSTQPILEEMKMDELKTKKMKKGAT